MQRAAALVDSIESTIDDGLKRSRLTSWDSIRRWKQTAQADADTTIAPPFGSASHVARGTSVGPRGRGQRRGKF
jgi:hypothetical protein